MKLAEKYEKDVSALRKQVDNLKSENGQIHSDFEKLKVSLSSK